MLTQSPCCPLQGAQALTYDQLQVRLPDRFLWLSLEFKIWQQQTQLSNSDPLQGLTYLQVKGSGVANTCPVINGGTSDLKALKVFLFACAVAAAACQVCAQPIAPQRRPDKSVAGHSSLICCLTPVSLSQLLLI